MRVIAFSICALAILALGLYGVALAQERMPQQVVVGQPATQQAPRGAAPAAAGQPGQPGQAAAPRVPIQGLPTAGQPAAAGDGLFRQQVGYAIGRDFGDNLRENDVDLDINMLMTGIAEGLQNAKPRWTDAELGAAMLRFRQEMQQKGEARIKVLAVKNKQQEDQFLAENKKRDGVQSTPSGLQYKVLKQGNGASPTTADMVQCNYRGQLLDGTEFDSSQQHGGPQTFPVGRTADGRGVIAGWSEALQKMKVGDKWQLFVPARLAYDNDPPGAPIEPGSMLIFEIELLGIVNSAGAPGR